MFFPRGLHGKQCGTGVPYGMGRGGMGRDGAGSEWDGIPTLNTSMHPSHLILFQPIQSHIPPIPSHPTFKNPKTTISAAFPIRSFPPRAPDVVLCPFSSECSSLITYEVYLKTFFQPKIVTDNTEVLHDRTVPIMEKIV